jgi:purine-binding chemotaxis protein CheW
MPDVVVVEAGGRRLAVPAARVREVTAVSSVTPLPTAPPPVIGLTQLRGQIVPVIDLGAPDENRTPRPQDPLVVVELGPARAALWVERVLGVQPASDTVSYVDIGVLFDQLRAKVLP